VLDLNVQFQWSVSSDAPLVRDQTLKAASRAAGAYITLQQASSFDVQRCTQQHNSLPTSMLVPQWLAPIKTVPVATSPVRTTTFGLSSTPVNVALDPLAAHLTTLPRIRTSARGRYAAAYHSRAAAAAAAASPIPLPPPPPSSLRAEASQHSLHPYFDLVNSAAVQEAELSPSEWGDSEDDAISIGSGAEQEHLQQQQGGFDGDSDADLGRDSEELVFSPCSCRAWLQPDSARSLLSL
jgi:hypothetical protein